MKLRILAEKVARLPDFEFKWGGPEQFWVGEEYGEQEGKFESETKDLVSMRNYVRSLKERMAEYAVVLSKLIKAYKELRDIILEADIESDFSSEKK